jgi:hypothetical protein
MSADTLIEITLIETPYANLVAMFVWLSRDRTRRPGDP